MANLVENPVLPRPGYSADIYAILSQNADTIRVLENYLRKIASRANGSWQIGDPLPGPLTIDGNLTVDGDLDVTGTLTGVGAVFTGLTITGIADGVLATVSDVVTPRTLTGTANQIAVADGDGAAGDPTFSLTAGDLVSGSYTPTFTAGTNVAATVGTQGFYIRVGDIVHVYARGTVDPTAAAPTTTTYDISLPIASDLAASSDLIGVMTNNGGGNTEGFVLANTTSNRATVQFSAGNATNATHMITFSYRIL